MFVKFLIILYDTCYHSILLAHKFIAKTIIYQYGFCTHCKYFIIIFQEIQNNFENMVIIIFLGCKKKKKNYCKTEYDTFIKSDKYCSGHNIIFTRYFLFSINN